MKLDLLEGEDVYCAVFCTWQMMVADPRSCDGSFGVDFEGSLVVTNYRYMDDLFARIKEKVV